MELLLRASEYGTEENSDWDSHRSKYVDVELRPTKGGRLPVSRLAIARRNVRLVLVETNGRNGTNVLLFHLRTFPRKAASACIFGLELPTTEMEELPNGHKLNATLQLPHQLLHAQPARRGAKTSDVVFRGRKPTVCGGNHPPATQSRGRR